MRMVALIVAAVGILVEGLAIGGLLFVLGGVVDAYSMSLNGTDPAQAQAGIRVMAVVLGASLVALAAVLLLAALRRRPARRLTVLALVVQCIVVTIAGVALGWETFAGTLLVLGTLLYALLAEDDATALPDARAPGAPGGKDLGKLPTPRGQ